MFSGIDSRFLEVVFGFFMLSDETLLSPFFTL